MRCCCHTLLIGIKFTYTFCWKPLKQSLCFHIGRSLYPFYALKYGVILSTLNSIICLSHLSPPSKYKPSTHSQCTHACIHYCPSPDLTQLTLLPAGHLKGTALSRSPLSNSITSITSTNCFHSEENRCKNRVFSDLLFFSYWLLIAITSLTSGSIFLSSPSRNAASSLPLSVVVITLLDWPNSSRKFMTTAASARPTGIN
ncbi:hypothetical protein SPONN_1263 [uncultured Candidatus Thioglobus sp.]|nr:hypothetical protein SPONN_1263 [uncultured Candidatus Thioglobus sp.]